MMAINTSSNCILNVSKDGVSGDTLYQLEFMYDAHFNVTISKSVVFSMSTY